MIRITQKDVIISLPRLGHSGFLLFNWALVFLALAGIIVIATGGFSALSLQAALTATVVASANLILHYLVMIGKEAEQREDESELYSRPSRLSTPIVCNPFGEIEFEDAVELAAPYAEPVEDDKGQSTEEIFRGEIERVLRAKDLHRLDGITDEELGMLPMPMPTVPSEKMNVYVTAVDAIARQNGETSEGYVQHNRDDCFVEAHNVTLYGWRYRQT